MYKEQIFFFYYLKNDLSYSRFAVSVNRKTGKAVERSYIKRRMRELYRLNRDKLSKNYDLWILVKKKFGKKESSEIERIFIESLQKIEKL